MKNRIEHSGQVESVSEDKVRVRILQASACSACEAKALCHSSESKEKIIECRTNGQAYAVGEQVMVYGSMAMGRNAVILAFVVPLVVIVVWLFCAVGIFHINELLAIGIMVVLLAIYYLTLHLMNGVLSKQFEFWIDKKIV
ncbi:MAG: SoxR reducing system RseC family protein [Bacteroidaceae bacterium]|jgi:sigma-E factor negative regulatory protein RseC|nr:SoxR reducing system RseC family protein [Bacteroidaceae bacterium]